MIDKLSAALDFHQEALNLRRQRHEVLASNIANADTPNYKARDFDFTSELDRVMARGRAGQQGLALSTTVAGHIDGGLRSGRSVEALQYRVPAQPSLDGNTVDMDIERAKFADNSVRYQASLTLLNSRIQGLKSAMQPE
ncbi:flagellar basal body rod protein FlgB [Halomonas sp. YLGW01]|uniref:flagellar basal body rod protein FlgB n=1 Tax=Halomonas sp. YLGW01 TaxID=2773308 RepID=UPI0017850208|nr:flagellar basal body rod protein FlgB [Halomonas sp. YLGW01]